MNYPSIRIEGSIVSPELFDRLDELPGQRPADFGLAGSATVKDEIARAWADAQDYWRIFHRKLETMPANATGTTETRNLWVVPLLGLLGYQLEYQQRGPELNAKVYPISHRAANRANTPVHIIGYRDGAGLDRKPERSGGPRMSAHALVQEYLNLSEQLYSVVTNGRLLRLLRDSSRLVKLTYLEFDLDRIFGDGLFADFAVLYRLLHSSRLPTTPEGVPNSLIERYHQDSVESGARIRDGLSFAVEKTLQDLANGFLAHPKNDALRAAIINGQLTAPVFYQTLLRLVYRLLFLFVVEERDLVYPKDGRTKRDLYYRYYSLQRIRGLAKQQYLHDRRHADLWFAVLACFRLFETGGTGDKLGISPLAGHLFNLDAIGPLRDAHLDNATVLSAIVELCTFHHPDTNLLTAVNYGALATEEFGSVYERLLELHPVFLKEADLPRFTFKQAAGNERKTTGSYYTPSSLVECLLDSALDPVVERRLKGKKATEAEQALLSLRVCDPAVGSGHFLIAAGHRLARRLAILRAGDDEPSPDQLRHALREVISHCLYGVDVNPMSVELCKVTLWLEATEPGKPLSFLDHHIQCGNSLLGATPHMLSEGLPDDAFKPLIGDDAEICKEAKMRNKDERKQLALFHGTETAPWERLGALPAAMLEVDTMSDDTAAALQSKEQRYAELVRSAGYLQSRFLADAWCASFVWKKTRDLPYPITNDVLRKIERNPHDCATWMREEIEHLSSRYQFFHWHLAFPEVFSINEREGRPINEHTGWNGGFDVMLGNPPWDKLQSEELQFFSTRKPDIAALVGAKRKQAIDELLISDPTLATEWREHRRFDAGTIAFVRNSGLYPLTAVGKFNTFALFAELGFRTIDSLGRLGCVVPSGIATDDTTKEFFGAIVVSRALIRLYDFENRKGLFPSVDSRFKFCLLTVAGSSVRHDQSAEFVFYATDVSDTLDSDRRFTLTADEISILNPNTKNCATFRTRRDADITKLIYSRVPVFFNESNLHSNAYKPAVWRLLNTTDDSGEFLNANDTDQVLVPVVEAKSLHQFDHRFAGFVPADDDYRELSDSDKRNPSLPGKARYYVRDAVLRQRLPDTLRSKTWFMTARNITNATNERTFIASVFPRGAGCELTPYIEIEGAAKDAANLLAAFNSFAFDFVTRQKVGGTHLSYFIIYQLPVLPPAVYAAPCAWSGSGGDSISDWLLPRLLELIYTSWDLASFAKECDWEGPPFAWDEPRRFQIRCELDAAFFHFYGLNRDEAAYILDTFPIVRRKDEAAHGTYRTKNTILAIYDQLAAAQSAGTAFASPLNPPPGDNRACHPKRKLAILAFGSLRHDPGLIGKHVAFRIKTETPFQVEYGRLSQSRGGGPTLVPHGKGAKVEAELLILPDDMPLTRAHELLWRRERRKEDSDESYSAGTGPNAVLVRESSDCPWVETILYTDFNASGKVTLSADALAKAAIESVSKAPENKDGISYLASAMEAGIWTPLTAAYRDTILRVTGVDSLADALVVAKTGKRPAHESTDATAEAKPAKKPRKKAVAQQAPAPELNLGLDIFGNVVAPARSWGDDVFAVPNAPRHGVLPEDLYTRQWLHALFSLHASGLTGSQVFDSFRLLLSKDSRKVIAQSGDKNGTTWLKAFNQPVQLTTFFASLLQRATDGEIEVSKAGGEVRLQRATGWFESPSAWVRADAEITQRALRDQELRSQLLPFIALTPEVAAFNEALTKMAQ